MCSTAPDRGGPQLVAGGPRGGAVCRGGRRTPNLGLQTLSLAILSMAMPISALPLTCPALPPWVTGWDCSYPLNLTVSAKVQGTIPFPPLWGKKCEQIINSKKFVTRDKDNFPCKPLEYCTSTVMMPPERFVSDPQRNPTFLVRNET